MVKKALILAGGLGTRLRAAVSDLPKCMAPVAGRPFLAYLIDYYKKQGIENFLFSVGYKSEHITAFLKSYHSLQYKIIQEQEPLGTGGALQLALENEEEEDILILNGDTFFKLNVLQFSAFHDSKEGEISLALKPMENFSRYGMVELASDKSITVFREKQFYATGYINAGCYLLKPSSFLKYPWPQKFSFEKDYLENNSIAKKMYGYVEDAYFIDIGIPEDYYRAQTELPKSFEK